MQSRRDELQREGSGASWRAAALGLALIGAVAAPLAGCTREGEEQRTGEPVPRMGAPAAIGEAPESPPQPGDGATTDEQ